MAVVILNISEQYGQDYGVGDQLYSLRINHLELCKLNHKFEDGLASLLRAAADALDVEEKINYTK